MAQNTGAYYKRPAGTGIELPHKPQRRSEGGGQRRDKNGPTLNRQEGWAHRIAKISENSHGKKAKKKADKKATPISAVATAKNSKKLKSYQKTQAEWKALKKEKETNRAQLNRKNLENRRNQWQNKRNATAK